MSGAYRLIVFVFLLWPGAVAAQRPDVLIGRVTDPAHQPIMGARVEALSSRRNSRLPSSKDATGAI